MADDAVTRFAPSPTGPLHLGHAYAALVAASLAAPGRFLLRIEDIDQSRCRPEYEAMIAEDYQKCLDIAKDQTRDGAHMLDLNVDYVGRDGAADMTALASRFATSSTLPIMLDSTEPEVIRAGLESLGGRCAVNSVNYEDGDGPDSRFTKIMQLVVEHGAAVVALAVGLAVGAASAAATGSASTVAARRAFFRLMM